MTENPYVMRWHNLIVSRMPGRRNQTEAVALYEIFQDHSDFTSEDEDAQRLAEVEATIAKLKRAGTLIQIPTRFDPESELRVDEENAPEELNEAYEQSIANQKKDILRTPFEHRLYLAISTREILGHPWKDFLNTFLETIRNPLRRMEARLGGQPFTLAKSQWDRYKLEEQKTYRLLQTYFDVRRLSHSEISWMLERPAMRGVEPKRIDEFPDLVEHSGEGEQAQTLVTGSPAEILPVHDDVEVDPGIKGMLKFEKEYPGGVRRGYFSFMVVKQIPSGWSHYPSVTGLFKLVQQLFDFPVEISVQFVPQAWEYTVRQIGRARSWTREKGKSDAKRGKEQGQRTTKQLRDSQALMEENEEKEYPMFRAQITLCVWGETPDQVVERRAKVAEMLDQYKLIVPKQLQKLIFYNTLPAVPARTVGNLYQLKLTSRWLAALHFTGGVRLGDESGYLVGYTGLHEQIPVLIDPMRGARDPLLSATSSTIDFGAPGTGKSLLANYMIVMEILRGGKGLIFDPKNERWAWPFEIPYLKDKVNIVTLREGSEDRGKLDPLLRVQDPAKDRNAINSAKRIMWYLTKNSSDTWAGKALGYAIDDVVDPERRKALWSEGRIKGRRPCMARVIELLETYLDGDHWFDQFPDKEFVRKQVDEQIAQAVADLRYHSQSSLAQLLFAQGTESPIDWESPLTILQVRGLQQQSEEDPTNRLRKAVFMGVADVCREFVEQKAEFRTVLFDELYDFTAEPEIAVMIRVLLRTGRSMNNKVQLCTHNMRDLVLEKEKGEESEDQASEVRSNLGNRFVYRVDDEAEARKACQFLGIPPTTEHIDLLTSREVMHSGRFLLRDFHGRVGLVTFRLDQLDPVLYEAFRTDEKANKRREREYGHLRFQSHQQESLKVVK